MGLAMLVVEACLEQHPQGLEQKVLRQVAVDTHQPFTGVDVHRSRCQAAIEPCEWPLCHTRVEKGLTHGPVQRVVAEVVRGLAVGATLDQGFHQGHVARRGRRHQGRHVHRQTVLHPMPVALAQNFLEVVREVKRVTRASLACPLHPKAFGRVEFRLLHQPCGQYRLVVAGRDVIELLFELATQRLLAKYLAQQVFGAGLVINRPRYRHLFQDGTADGISLFLLALQFQFAGFLLPVFLR